MAMICKSGARECDGCMACHTDPEPIGRCAVCKEPIYADEDRYDMDGDLLHEDCLAEWARKYLKEGL